MTRRLLAGLVLGTLVIAAAAQQKTEKKEKTEKVTARLNFVVIRDANGKPVRNAEIVLHPLDKTGRQKQEGLELKTHEDGTATVGGIPFGKMRIQVIAQGFRTYGEDFDIQLPNHDITIKMQRPTDQYSIYK
jgi:hypothetical protein